VAALAGRGGGGRWAGGWGVAVRMRALRRCRSLQRGREPLAPAEPPPLLPPPPPRPKPRRSPAEVADALAADARGAVANMALVEAIYAAAGLRRREPTEPWY
jgi:hypothetical protein